MAQCGSQGRFRGHVAPLHPPAAAPGGRTAMITPRGGVTLARTRERMRRRAQAGDATKPTKSPAPLRLLAGNRSKPTKSTM